MVLLLVGIAPAAAHRQPEVETTVQVLEAGDGTETMAITHRLHAHDAQQVLRLLGVHDPVLSDPENQARLALYARDRFEIAGDAPSEMVGVELEGNYVFIYQQHPEVAAIVASGILADMSDAWVNFVYLKDHGGHTVRSLVLNADHRTVPGEPAVPSP